MNLEKNLKNCLEIADDKLSRNYEDVEFKITREIQIKSDDSVTTNNQNTNALSSGRNMKQDLSKNSLHSPNVATFLDHRSKFQRFPLKPLWFKAPNIHFMM
ncbi:hypothetical protein TNCT_342991 [Trichonephila clavata]|uniref:Uncharacterized protein n=1 Tax=Trichonephila clavata TaxID=2740835 RepID=A0A8X6LTY2_TRICU|nr:hypothetical protein TNCT_342991 [Trichonephila clavata]